MRRANTDLITLTAALVGGFLLLRSKPVWALPANGLPYKHLLDASEREHGLPKGLLGRVAYQESRFRDDIVTGDTVSSANAQGIMQIVPKWHPDVDPLNPAQAIPYAAAYLKRLFTSFGDWQLALGAYNWGQGNMRKWLAGEKTIPTETRNYIDQISQDLGL